VKKRAINALLVISTIFLVAVGNSQKSVSQNVDLSLLPDGNYFFKGAPSSDLFGKPITILFQKRRDKVTGITIAFLSENDCFRGQLRKNTIEKVIFAIPTVSRQSGPGWEITPGSRPISLEWV
jgi:hypothetical protein